MISNSGASTLQSSLKSHTLENHTVMITLELGMSTLSALWTCWRPVTHAFMPFR